MPAFGGEVQRGHPVAPHRIDVRAAADQLADRLQLPAPGSIQQRIVKSGLLRCQGRRQNRSRPRAPRP